jgi:WD40 repeat protein
MYALNLRDSLDHADDVESVDFSPDGRLFATCDFSFTLTLWQPHPLRKIRKSFIHSLPRVVRFSPLGNRLATATGLDHNVRIINTDDLKTIQVLKGNEQEAVTLDWSRDGRFLASGDIAGGVVVWDMVTGKRAFRTEIDSIVQSVRFSPNSRLLAVAYSEGITFLTLPRWNKIHEFKVANRTLSCFAFSSGGDKIAISSGFKTHEITLYQFDGSRRLATICRYTDHQSTITSVRFARNGLLLASASIDSNIGIWDVRTGQGNLKKAHRASCTDVVFHPNARTLVSVGNDRRIRVWDIVKEKP